ncbi:thiamine phosphate synthase [Edaphobacter bradus]|uniref:thiamine phosphate synthase n=1 Tax=Edaphobacter bradus TaxID=2259016 RepID=UPI0021E0DFFF|nr:thiamine phosphate synthase [Edaphobacter bradus]
MLRCAITDRTLWTGGEAEHQAALVRQAALWTQQGIDLIQLREKDLPAEALASLARQVLEAVRAEHAPPRPTRLLINSNVEVALAVAAHGVHLTPRPATTPVEIRRLYAEARLPAPVISISCHTLAEVEQARASQVDAILFAPVFGKTIEGEVVTQAAGLEALKAACLAAAPVPVYALGGVTHENASLCLEAGAAGIAGIRLFHQAS